MSIYVSRPCSQHDLFDKIDEFCRLAAAVVLVHLPFPEEAARARTVTKSSEAGCKSRPYMNVGNPLILNRSPRAIASVTSTCDEAFKMIAEFQNQRVYLRHVDLALQVCSNLIHNRSHSLAMAAPRSVEHHQPVARCRTWWRFAHVKRVAKPKRHTKNCSPVDA